MSIKDRLEKLEALLGDAEDVRGEKVTQCLAFLRGLVMEKGTEIRGLSDALE